MTEIKVYECDGCGYISKQDDPNMTTEQEMRNCANCNKDFCGGCAEDHVRDESGLVW